MSDTPITKTLQQRWGRDSDIDVEEILESHEQFERGLNQAETRIKEFESAMYSNAYEMEQLILRHAQELAAMTAECDRLREYEKQVLDDLRRSESIRAAFDLERANPP